MESVAKAIEGIQNVVVCHDAVGRARWLRMFVGERGLVIVAPPGEVAVIDLTQVSQLRAWLDVLSPEDVSEAAPPR
jgi:hypothetical protein